MEHKMPKRIISFVLALVLVCGLAFIPQFGLVAYANEWSPDVEKPVLIITGSGVVGGNPTESDLTSGIAYEKAYTMDELEALASNNTYVYSSLNSVGTKRIYKASGVLLTDLFLNTAFTQDKHNSFNVKLTASDGYSALFDISHQGGSIGGTQAGSPPTTQAFGAERKYFPNFADENPNDENAQDAPSILALKSTYLTAPQIPADTEVDTAAPRLIIGQLTYDDMNNPMFNQRVQKVIVGDELPNILKIGNSNYSRTQLLIMDRYTGSYTYTTQSGSRTDYAQGVPLLKLLTGYDDSAQVEFISADGYANPIVTIGDIKNDSNKYLLAYANGSSQSGLKGIYDTAKNDSSIHGYLTVYAQDKSPVKMVNAIRVTSTSGIDFPNSPFKHINNGGLSGQSGPYDIDAITGATLTIEGPAVIKSTPMSIRQLEGKNEGAFRGQYTDNRPSATTLTYEGIKLSHILNNLKVDGIEMTNQANKVLIKNRVRQTIAEFTIQQIQEADANNKPIIVAYGTSNGTNTAPFVYDNASGYISALGNDDGCIKLVYDKTAISNDQNSGYTKFANMAYIYVEEESSPGFKHTVSPYDTPENNSYVVTVTGDKLGREVNYTVKQLENMVSYDSSGKPQSSGMGYRDEYSLANSNYWYVNEYEGVKLWDLLLKSGVNQADLSAMVKFRATDGYVDFDNFTLEQIKNPNLFGYYEKNPNDNNDGKYVPQPSDLIRSGFPVLVAYGVNKYPYVTTTSQQGYKSGFDNSGGPVRIISGKMNYSHANGSKQAKLLDKIIVGTEINYSTHKSNNTNAIYNTLAQNPIAVEIVGMDGSVIKSNTYKISDIEDLIYGSVTNQQKRAASIKDFYGIEKSGTVYTDLYEGVNFKYFLENIVQIPGNKGTIEFTYGQPSQTVSYTIDELFATGDNPDTKKTGLQTVLAFAKNGYPMVADKNEGYVNTYKDGRNEDVTVKNDGGPLALITARVNGQIKSVLNVTKIKISLQADKYAHIEPPYNSLASNTVTVEGEGTRLDAAKTFTVGELEGKQTIALTGDYSIKSATASEQTRFRGINLYEFLKSTDVGLKPNASEIILKSSDNKTVTLPLADLLKSDYVNTQAGVNNLRVILAYGSASVTNPAKEDGKPLVKTTTDAGYVAAYKNSGGPICLVVGQKDEQDQNAGKILKDIVSIKVNASAQEAWNHSISPVYQQYLNEKYLLKVVDGADGKKELFSKTYSLAQLEAMESLILRDDYTYVGTNTEEGLDLWKFIKQEAAAVSSIDAPSQVNVVAGDGFSRDLISLFGADALKNGIIDGTARKIIVMSYASNAKPLVPSTSSEGYVSNNDGGPLRLITQNNQGACLKNLRTIEVVVNGGTVNTDADFTLKGSAFDAEKSFSVAQLKANSAKTTKPFKWFDSKANPPAVQNDSAVGIPLATLLNQNGITGNNHKVSLITIDGYNDSGKYLNIPIYDLVDKDYFVAFEVNGNAIADDIKGQEGKTPIRIYRNLQAGSNAEPTDWRNRITNIIAVEVESQASEQFTFYPADGQAGNLPLSGIRAVVPDNKGGIWVGTYGAGAAYISESGAITRYNSTSNPALKSDFVADIAVDNNGGVWLTQSGNYEGGSPSSGVAYLKNGTLTYYDTGTANTIPDNYVQEVKIDANGNVWFGSFGGLTKYTPSTGIFKTWTVADGLPAHSVDNFTFDNKGGVWIGTYPDDSGSGTDYSFAGGYAYLNAQGEIKAYKPEASEGVNTALLADFWVRSIAVDANGGVYVVRSGSYPTLANVGGRVDYIAPNGTITYYKGKDLISDLEIKATATFNPEIRTVTVDNTGNIWFGTSGLGIYKGENINSLNKNYSGTNDSWPKAGVNDNIYVVNIASDGSVYVGSSGGVAVKTNSAAKPQLSSLKITGKKLTPSFNPTTYDYELKVESNASSIEISPKAEQTNAQISIDNAVLQGTSKTIALNNNVTTVTIQVSASGSSRTYTLKVYKATDATDATAPIDATNKNTPVVVDTRVGGITLQTGATPNTTNPVDMPMVMSTLKNATGRDQVSLYIPVNQVTAAANNWDGKIKLPQVLANSSIKISNSTVDFVVSLGSEQTELNFLTPVRIVLHGMAGKKAAFKNPGKDTITEITYAMREDNQLSLGNEKAGYIDVDGDLVVWTKHMSEYIAYRKSGGSDDNGDYDLEISGAGVNSPYYFTLEDLKSKTAGIVSSTYTSLNNFGTKSSYEFEGISMQYLLNNVVSLKSSAKSISVIAEDGYTKRFNLDSNENGIYSKDMYNNPVLLAWLEDGKSINLKFVIGQSTDKHLNKPLWVDNIKRIVVNSETVTSGEGSSGGYGSGTSNTPTAEEKTTAGEAKSLDIEAKTMVTKAEDGTKVFTLDKDIIDEIKGKTVPINLTVKASEEQDWTIVLPTTVVKAIKDYKQTVLLKVKGSTATFEMPLDHLTQKANANTAFRVECKKLNDDKGFELQAWQKLSSDVYDITLYSIFGGTATKVSTTTEYFTLTIPVTNATAYNQMAGMRTNENGALAYQPTVFKSSGDTVYATISSYKPGNMAIVTTAKQFTDIENHWAKSTIEAMANKSLVIGKENNLFYPDSTITKAEFLTIINRAMAYPQASTTAPIELNNKWYQQEIAIAIERGLIAKDISGINFDEQITRSEMAVILYNGAQSSPVLNSDSDLTSLETFEDFAAITDQEATQLAWAVQNGIMLGDDTNKIRPSDSATRAESLIMIIRYLEALNLFTK